MKSKEYTKGARINNPDLTHDIMISINQNNQDYLKKFVDDVSNPSSLNYGKYLSFEEVGKLVENPTATAAVSTWLLENNVEIIDQTEYGEYIYARASISKLEKLFDTTFHEFKRAVTYDNAHVLSSDSVVIRAISYSIPEHLDQHIHAVHKLSTLPTVSFETATMKPLSSADIESIKGKQTVNMDEISRRLTNPLERIFDPLPSTAVTPYILAQMYGIVGDSHNFGSQSVYGYGRQTYLQSDITEFLNLFTNPAVNNIINNIEPIPNPEVCNEDIYYYYGESTKSLYCRVASMGLEYITSVAGNIPTYYYVDAGPASTGGPDYVGWLVNITRLANPPLVNCIGYASYEYTIPASDLNSFYQEAVKLSARGVTIVASSGNDGVSGRISL